MSSASEQTVFLARQPIYDRRLKVYGYELLYRKGLGTQAGEVGLQQSAETLLRALVEIGLDRLVGQRMAFINIPADLLTDPALHLLPKDRVILEILETTEPTDEALEAAKGLAEAGFKIALDDYILGSPLIHFLPFAKIVKVDVTGNSTKMLDGCFQILKKEKVRILAEKVETMEMFARCQAMGSHYFQGYFCSKPEIIEGRGVPSSRGYLVHLLTRLQDPRVSLDELEKLVVADVGLTYRLLRMVNSALVGIDEEVDSVKKALLVLGLQRVRSLVSLLALAGIDGKPTELLITAMIRAKMCEAVAPVLDMEDEFKHFTVGLLSVLDAMFDTPMEEVLSQIPLTQDIKDALCSKECNNQLGRSLSIVLAFESGQWDKVREQDEKAPEISRCYVDAVQWADQVESCMAA